MIYYISDTHFGHENVIKFNNRPFKSVEEMDEVLISNWNEVVKERDKIYILGDLIYKNKKPAEWYLDRLNGEKYLIRGNHEGYLRKIEQHKYFKSVNDYLEVNDEGRRVILFHYPILEWNAYHKGAYHIYGHIHFKEKLLREERALNAGVDINNYKPCTLGQLIQNSRFIK